MPFRSVLLFFLALSIRALAVTETFDNAAPSSSYTDGSFVGVNGITWNYVATRNEDAYAIDGKGLMLRQASSGSRCYSQSIPGGIRDFSVQLKKGFTGSGDRQVELFVSGESKGLSVAFDDTDIRTFSVTGINQTGPFTIDVRNVTEKQVVIDNLTWTPLAGSDQPPLLTLDPPALAPSIAVSNAYTITLTATEPDGDTVTLAASQLPPGATLVPETNIGAAPLTSTFAWTPAVTGAFSAVFTVSDDGQGAGDAVQVDFTVHEAGPASELLISEYGEGSSYNKYIELFNGTGGAVDLGPYSLKKDSNGGGVYGSVLGLSGALAHNETYVIVHSNSGVDPALAARADLRNGTALNFNGDDQVVLTKNDIVIDHLGVPGEVVWGRDVTLIRKSTVTAPNASYDPAEWDQAAQDSWDDVGLHAMVGLETPATPPLIALDPPQTNVTVMVDVACTMSVTATEPNGDTMTLTSSVLPPGAVLTPTTNVGPSPLLSSLAWTPASTGVFWATFTASDPDGAADPVSVRFSVIPQGSPYQSVPLHFNEVRADEALTDSNEFVEIIAPAGTGLAGCSLVHYNGSSTGDDPIWRFTFPAFEVPDDGVTDVDGVPLGFIVLAQTNSTVTNRDFYMPFTSPTGDLQNGPDGLVLYDPASNVLDAFAWEGAGDLATDDPGTLVDMGPPSQANFLHVKDEEHPRDGTSFQAPNDILNDSGKGWLPLLATPGALNNSQTDGEIVLLPPPPPPYPEDAMLFLVK